MIKTIFIANIAEIAKPITKFMAPAAKAHEIFEDHVYCDRFSLAAEDNRALITPLPLDQEFFRDTCRLLNFKNTINLHPKQPQESICRAILKDKQLFNQLITLIKANPEIKITSYAASREFIEFIQALNQLKLKFQTPEIPPLTQRWVADFFDSKAGFRQAVANLNSAFPAMPQGVICHSQEAVINWAKHFQQRYGGVVIKLNRGLAGEGVEIINSSRLGQQNFTRLATRILDQQPYWKKSIVVVEEYIEPDQSIAGGAPSVEMKITQGHSEFLYSCGMRINPHGVFMGIEFGKQAVPRKIGQQMIPAAKKFARYLASLGYQGFFDVDWVWGKNGRLYPLEANLRRTGGTHAYEMAKRLLGEDFNDNYYLISQMKTPANRFKNKNYSQLKAQLGNLFYPIKNRREGIIIAMANYLTAGKLGYVVIAKNKARAAAIETQFLSRIN